MRDKKILRGLPVAQLKPNAFIVCVEDLSPSLMDISPFACIYVHMTTSVHITLSLTSLCHCFEEVVLLFFQKLISKLCCDFTTEDSLH